jgi:hypothetical protein
MEEIDGNEEMLSLATISLAPRYRRRPCTLPKLQGGWGSVWTDAFQVSIRRDQPNRRYIKVRGRDDAGDALRSGSYHAGAFGEVVLAQGLGREDRQAPRDERRSWRWRVGWP